MYYVCTYIGPTLLKVGSYYDLCVLKFGFGGCVVRVLSQFYFRFLELF